MELRGAWTGDGVVIHSSIGRASKVRDRWWMVRLVIQSNHGTMNKHLVCAKSIIFAELHLINSVVYFVAATLALQIIICRNNSQVA